MLLIPTISDQDTFFLLKDVIKKREPFTFTRFGDGDVAVLKRKDFIAKALCNNWGFQYPDEKEQAFNDMGEVLKRALRTDMLGILAEDSCPMKKVFLDGRLYTKDFESWGLPVPSIIADHQICRSSYLGSIKSFRELLGDLKGIHIIGTYVDGMRRNNLDQLLGCPISYTKVDRKDKLQDRETRLQALHSIKETVVLWANGAGGKDTGVYLRDKFGKICIDMGATLDAWGGVPTRQWFNPTGIQSHCLIVKGEPKK